MLSGFDQHEVDTQQVMQETNGWHSNCHPLHPRWKYDWRDMEDLINKQGRSGAIAASMIPVVNT